MLLGILALFAAAALAPLLVPRLGRLAGAGFALLPAGLFVSLLGQASEIAAGATARETHAWAPSLGLSLSFVLDGLSLLFALLISGIGALVLVYAAAYLEGDARLGRLLGTLLVFMGAMLGVVLSDNLLALFVFWELTSIASYLLVGFDHEKPEARAAALQALLVTGGGGLALLAGILLLGRAGGSYEISLLATGVHPIVDQPLYLPILLLILAGAFSKSAQWPFHFWLPGAMAAPTPVSAYLHSATMVKAGIYLLLRLNPVLGGTDAWHYVITLTGALTMLTGALLALPQTDLKRILAYTTVSTLGALVLLIGLDTSQAVKAALVLLLVHALYKGALFLAAGILDHETGTRDIERLGGLARAMPITATASVLAALSMAGLPPLFGFIGKELLYEAKTQAPSAAWLVTSAGLLANVLVFAASGLVALRPFFGRRPESTREVHEAGPGLWLGPVVLAIAGLLLGVLPNTTFGPLLEAALGAVRAETTAIELALWHGLNPILLLSLATVGAGAALYLLRGPALAALAPLRPLLALGPARAYAWGLEALVATAKATAALLQGGSLRHHVAVVVAVTLGLAGGALLTHGATFVGPDFTDLLPHETLLAALLLAGAVATALFASRLAAVAALGVVGLAVALTFLLFGGPDLAMTQLAVETLSVILFVFVVYRLPRFARLSSTATRLRDLALAIAGGALMTVLVWTASAGASGSVLSEYFARASAPEAKGRNVVNVILVDFRALDTLGEITVLATAALGVFALLRLRRSGGRS